MVVVDPFTSENRDRRVFEDVETVFAGVQGKSFNAHTEVAVEEMFYVAAATPCMIAADVMVVGAEHGVPFTGALDNICQPKIRIVLGIGESIGAPEIHIPFEIAVPLGAGWNVRDLLHFLSRFSIVISNVGIITLPSRRGCFGFGAFATEQPGKDNPDISHWRIVRGPEQ